MRAVIGLIVALSLGLLAVRPLAAYERSALEARATAATAGELRQIAQAAQEYVQKHYTEIESETTPDSGLTVSMAGLVADGDLPQSVTAVNPFGQTWEVQIVQPTAGQLETLVLSIGGAAIPEHQAPAIAAQTGQEGGFVPYPGQYGTLTPSVAEGAYGHWQIPLAGFTNPGAGHVAALLAYNNGNLENDYLYRVKEPGHPELNTMETALNMGGNDINNADNVTAANGAITLGTANTSACNANARLHLAGSEVWDGCDGDLHLYPGGGNSSAVATSANMQVAGRLGTAGESATSGYPAGWSGGIHSWDIYANGSVGVGSNGSLGAWLQNNGYGGVSDTFSVGSRLELGTAFGAANAGWGCGPNGEIAANANGSGQLMACVNGKWKAAGASGFTQSYQMGIGNGAWYQNTGSTPMFISSNCNNTPFSSGYVENVTIIVRNSSGQQVSSSRGQVQEGGSDANFAAAPSASAIIPPGYIFDVVGSNMACSLSVTK